MAVARLRGFAGVVTARTQQATGATSTESTAMTREVKGGVVESVAGNKVVLREQDGLHEYTLPDGFKFQVNGQPVGVDQITPGTQVGAMITDKVTTRNVTLTRVASATVMQVAPGGIVVKTANGDLKSYNFKDAAGNDIYFVRDGKEVPLSTVKKGERLSGTFVTTLPPSRSPSARWTPGRRRGGACSADGRCRRHAAPLPRTASPLPLLGLLAVISAGIALTLRAARACDRSGIPVTAGGLLARRDLWRRRLGGSSDCLGARGGAGRDLAHRAGARLVRERRSVAAFHELAHAPPEVVSATLATSPGRSTSACGPPRGSRRTPARSSVRRRRRWRCSASLGSGWRCPSSRAPTSGRSIAPSATSRAPPDPLEWATSALAGHRDGYFRVLKDVVQGDVIELALPAEVRRFRVARLSIVSPEETSVLAPTRGAELTLVTCYPFYFVGRRPSGSSCRRRWSDAGPGGRCVRKRPGGQGVPHSAAVSSKGRGLMRIVACVAALVCGVALGQQQSPVIAVKTGRLLDPVGQKVRTGAVVVIQDGRIKSVGDAVPPARRWWTRPASPCAPASSMRTPTRSWTAISPRRSTTSRSSRNRFPTVRSGPPRRCASRSSTASPPTGTSATRGRGSRTSI
jgi:hypothetical protein